MVLPAGDLALSPEFEQTKADLESARSAYTALVEEYTHLIYVVGKNLESEYMLKLGKTEYELFSSQVEVLRLKREISLFQTARNRGEKISPEKIQKIIEKEFAEYQELLLEQQKKLQVAREHFSAKKFTAEETAALKKIYHSLVRKLHPDLNPDLPAGAAALWDRIQSAYQANDWNELLLLADLADEFLDKKQDHIETIDSLTVLREELDKITKKTADLKQRIAETWKRVPFSYKSLLEIPALLLIKREELNKQIKCFQERIHELKKIREQF